MFWLQIVSNFIKILREGQTPAQVAGGFALGSMVGFAPFLTIQGLGLWFIIFVLDVNLSAAFLAFTLFGLLGVLLDPAFHALGYYLLVDMESLRGIWTMLYNAPLAPLTRFNNTIVLGSLVGSVVLFVPVYFGMRSFVISYRRTLGARLASSKLYKALAQSSLVRWYQKVRDLGGFA